MVFQDDARLIKRSIDKDAAESSTLAEKFNDMKLYLGSTEQQIKKAVTDKQDLMVEENILKLEIRRLRSVLNDHADSVMRYASHEPCWTEYNLTIITALNNVACSSRRRWTSECKKLPCTKPSSRPNSRPSMMNEAPSIKVRR